MINRIAVGLDGSQLSEKVLPFATRLAKQLNAKVLLLQISYWPENENGDFINRDRKSTVVAVDYLNKVKNNLTDPGKPDCLLPEEVEIKVAYKKSIYQLADTAKAEGADILLLTTHGRSGFSLLVMGSIATGVLKHASIPVILVRPDEKEVLPPSSLTPAPVIATLDGSLGAEACLVQASAICNQLNVPLYLVEVVTTISPVIVSTMGMGTGYTSYDEEKEIQNLRKEATTYLGQIKRSLETANPHLVVEITTLVGDPAEEIKDYCRKIHPLFMAMASHCRGELGQLLLGSVAETVVRESHQPVLLTRIPKGYQGYRQNSEGGNELHSTAVN